MGTIQNALKFLLNKKNDTAEYVGLVNGVSGQPSGHAAAADLAAAMGEVDVLKRTGNVFVACYSSGSLVFKQAGAASYTNPIGAAIWDGGRMLIVAKDNAQNSNTKWSTATGDGGTEKLTLRYEANNDFEGKSKTAQIASFKGGATAVNLCLAYYPTGYQTDTLIGQGCWWLPSVGEVLTFIFYQREVNAILSAIGGTEIGGGQWASTEYSNASAWYYSVNTSHALRTGSKTTSSGMRARPVMYY